MPRVAHNATPKSGRSHGDLDVCVMCGDTIEFFESTAINGDVLDTWWSHRTHPADGHDAQPAPSGFQFVGTSESGVKIQ